MGVFEDMLARVGKTPQDIKKNSKTGLVLNRRGVPRSAELNRILSLPRRDWREQQSIHAELTAWLKKPFGTMELRPVQAAALSDLHDFGGLLAPVTVGGGKCLGLGTPVLKFNGDTVSVEDVRAGDELMGPDSKPRRVISTTRGRGPLYKIVPIKGESWVCNDVHMLTIVQSRTDEIFDISLDEFLQRPRWWKEEAKLFQPSLIQFPTQIEELPIDPYFLGVWFGDGTRCLNGVEISKPDPEIESLCRDVAKEWGLRVRISGAVEGKGPTCPSYHLAREKGRQVPNLLLRKMREIVGDSERLPRRYLLGSVETRRALLAGLLDADGHLHHGFYEIVQKRTGLAQDISFLARSLGLRVTQRTKYVNKNPYERLFISGDATALPLRIPRKIPAARIQKKNALRTGFRVEALGVGEYAGFELDGDGRFLLGNFTVTHNTLVSLLAAEVVEAKRPMLLIPAKLKRKTEIELHKYAKHWRFTPPRMISYEWLGRVQADDTLDEHGNLVKPGFLRQYQPDLIIADECHKLRATNTSVTRRIMRYMEANRSTRFVGMSGTITKRSIVDYAHILEWCLKDNSPCPLLWPVLRDWADALDEGIDEHKRMAPGALLLLANEEDLSKLQDSPLPTLRRAYQRRLVATPGIVATEESFVDCSLTVTTVEPNISRATEEAFEGLVTHWELPDGTPIPDPVSYWRHARELACGFFYKWDPPGPPEWMEARKAWCAFVRQTIKGTDLDSELQVAQAIYQKRLPDPPFTRTDPLTGLEKTQGRIYANWVAIRDSFKPNTVPVWLDDGPLEYAIDWMQRNTGIVWVEHTCFGKRLAEITGRPYFQRKGEDEKGRLIDMQDPREGSIIASIASNAEGRNLQAWNKNLVVSPPPTGSVWEQLLGREHRSGQEADEVLFELMMSALVQWADFEQARLDAKYINDSTGQLQKLTYADVDVMSPEEAAHRSGYQWAAIS